MLKKIIKEIGNMFSISETHRTDIVEKYPATYEKDPYKALKKTWTIIGDTMNDSIEKYDSES